MSDLREKIESAALGEMDKDRRSRFELALAFLNLSERKPQTFNSQSGMFAFLRTAGQEICPMRTLRILSAFLALAALTACASAIRLPGQRDPMVEVVRILADALKDQKAPLTPTPTPSPTPEGGR